MRNIASLCLLLVTTALASAAHGQVFYDNTGFSGVSASFTTTDELADDTPFSGTQHVASFTFEYLNTGSAPVDATVRFYTVDSTTGGVGSLVATIPVTGLPPSNLNQIVTINLDSSQQFDWTATPGIYNLQSVTGGFVSIQFSGPHVGWWEAAGTSLDGFYDLTTGQFITFQESNASFYLQISNSTSSSALSSIQLNPTTIKGGSTAKAKVTLTGPAPAGGVLVTLSSSKPAVAQVQKTVTIPAGATFVAVPVKTKTVQVNTRVTVSASLNGVTKLATLTVTP